MFTDQDEQLRLKYVPVAGIIPDCALKYIAEKREEWRRKQEKFNETLSLWRALNSDDAPLSVEDLDRIAEEVLQD